MVTRPFISTQTSLDIGFKFQEVVIISLKLYDCERLKFSQIQFCVTSADQIQANIANRGYGFCLKKCSKVKVGKEKESTVLVGWGGLNRQFTRLYITCCVTTYRVADMVEGSRL